MNKTLGYQIANYLRIDPETLPKSFHAFFGAISQTYDQFEKDLREVEIVMSALFRKQNDLTDQYQIQQ